MGVFKRLTEFSYPDTYELGENYKDDDIIRDDDLIRIVKPEMFVRCGYEHDYHNIKKRMLVERYSDISSALKSLGLELNDKNVNFLAGQMASGEMKSSRKSGVSRSIYTIYQKEFETYIARVRNITRCKTGTYFGGSCSYDSWGGGYDYEPAELSVKGCHTILEFTIDFNFQQSALCLRGQWDSKHFIEKSNVEKVRGRRWQVCRTCEFSKCAYNYHNDFEGEIDDFFNNRKNIWVGCEKHSSHGGNECPNEVELEELKSGDADINEVVEVESDFFN